MPRFWPAVLVGLALVAGSPARLALAQEKGDAWKGTALDPKWHLTILGDAQTEANAIEVKDGTLKITAGGSELFGAADNGVFLWQAANGDFEAVLEIRSLKKISDDLNSTKVGIMVRPNLDIHGPHVYALAMPKGTHLQSRPTTGETPVPLQEMSEGSIGATGAAMGLRC
jgi:hypothetical protein